MKNCVNYVNSLIWERRVGRLPRVQLVENKYYYLLHTDSWKDRAPNALRDKQCPSKRYLKCAHWV